MNIVISQSDVVTAYGWGLDALWDGLMRNQTAVQSTDQFKDRNFVSTQAAMVSDLKASGPDSRVLAMLKPLLSKLIGKLDPKTPLILSTTVGEIEYIGSAILGGSIDLALDAAPSALLRRIKNILGLTGPAMVVSSACASSAVALAQAASIVRRGEAPAVLLVAADAISEFVYSGFSTLQSLCETPAKPFDAGRCGLSLGEAAAWALVTSAGAAPLQQDQDAVSMLGWASASDAVHMTAPDRNAAGLSRAIGKACKMAGRNPADITFVAAHGTATVYSDAMELVAFRGAIPSPVPIFSIKGGTGHTLGAAGLVQILISARALSRGQVPPTVGLSNPDAAAAEWVHTSPFNLNNPSIALSTNSGFGGVNTAIVLGRAEPQPFRPAPAEAPNPIIRAISWSLGEESSDDITALVGKPVKYLSRMTPETRCCLVAACKALHASNLDRDAEIGIVAAGERGFLQADLEYFRDYVACGQSMGRGNLFIYTLPTSAASEVAIALGLKGPALYAQSDLAPVKSLISLAGQMLADGDAQAVLAIWSGIKAAVCFAVTLDGPSVDLNGFEWNREPLAMATALAFAERRP
jgi:3-oxoacyl-[acyl-carrier-protein] synthase II